MINNTQQIQEIVRAKHGQEVTQKFVAHVFRRDLGLRYKRVQRIAYNANTDKSIILRAMFAK